MVSVSNGGFKNITISNCVFDGCRGFALESVDGALLEDIPLTGFTMRNWTNTPIFLRLGRRMRGPASVPVGTLKRVLIRNVVSHNSTSQPGGAGLISGLSDYPIEDVKINEPSMDHRGGGTRQMADREVTELEDGYPEPRNFGDIPASGFYVRHVRNIEFTNGGIVALQPDAWPVLVLEHVEDTEFFRIKTAKNSAGPVFPLYDVQQFQVASSRHVKDTNLDKVEQKELELPSPGFMMETLIPALWTSIPGISKRGSRIATATADRSSCRSSESISMSS
jgi:hypothetical protein